MFIGVTNRLLCKDQGDFLERISRIATYKPYALILREKDLDQAAYAALARQCLAICQRQAADLVIHANVGVAQKLGIPDIHLPLNQLQENQDSLGEFRKIGVSVHSTEDAVLAERLGATYLIAGHIFATDCKRGLEGRGLSYLQNICAAVRIPVFGIGGITGDNIAAVMQTGAAGGCLMSGLMTCPDLGEALKNIASTM